MENFNKKVKEVKNINGKVIEKITTIQPKDKKGRISLESVDKLYKKLHVKSKEEGKKFMIKIMTLDGMKTLKNFDYDEDSLKYCFENEYYHSMPKEVRSKFEDFFYIQIIST